MRDDPKVDVLDPTRYDRRDTIGTVKAFAHWWSELGAGTRPDWAARDLDEQLAAIAEAAKALGVSVADAAEPLIVIDRTASVIATELRLDWNEDAAQELLRRSTLAIHCAGQAKRAAGLMPRTATGVAHQLNTSGGGVPKLPADSIVIAGDGVSGDRQASRQVHGRPWQALCLWSLEAIEALQREGHPIAPGSAGENVTIAGLPWEQVTAGVHLRIGEVLAEISMVALPCKQNARWFTDGDFMRMGAQYGPGASRMYAGVIEGGVVRAGDPVVLEPG
jgi:MOSC domain-containing protein YiiM